MKTSFNSFVRSARAAFAVAVFVTFFAVPAFAIKQPGLQWGALSSGSSLNTTAYPATTNIDLTVGKALTTSGWGANTTYVYWGQIYLDGSTYRFGENIDDAVWLKIGKGENATILLDNAEHDVVTYGNLVLNGEETPWYAEAGWYDFELRLYNGSGGAGPVAGSGFTSTKGFGYVKGDHDAVANLTTADWIVPADPNDATFLRYDDGIVPDKALVIIADVSASIKETNPDFFATRETLTPGPVIIPVPDEIYPVVDGASRYRRVGYVISAYDAEARTYTLPVSATLDETAKTLSFSCENGQYYRLEWLYDLEYLVRCSAADGLGVVSSDETWMKEGSVVTISATPNDSKTHKFLYWKDTAGNVYKEASSEITVTGPMELTAKFWKIDQPFVWYVKTTEKGGNNANDGLSPESAKATIKAALADIPDDTVATIYVFPGTYKIDNADVMLLKNPILISGLTDPETGEGVVLKKGTTTSYAEWYFLEINHADAIVENITFRGGSFRGGGHSGPSYKAASVKILGAGGTLRDCIIENAQVWHNDSIAASLTINSKGARVERCIVRNAVSVGTSQYTDVRSASGVLLMNGVLSDTLIYNCSVKDSSNISTTQPITGGLSLADAGTSWSAQKVAARVINCTVLNCTGNRTGGISQRTTKGSTFVIANTIVAGCKDFYSAGDDDPLAHNFMGETNAFHACASDDAVAINSGSGCLAGETAAALFRKYAVTTAEDGTVSLDFGNSDLRPSSLLANKGVSQIFDNDGNVTETFSFGEFDLAGKLRVQGSKIDIGAYEAPPVGLRISIR